MRIILTSHPAAAVTALEEARKADAGARLVKKLTQSEQLVEIALPYPAFAAKLREQAIFTRHVCPVTFEGAALPSVNELAGLLDKGAGVTVQTRNFRKAAEVSLADTLSAAGFDVNEGAPQVVSVYGCGETVYVGVSAIYDDISPYNGGNYRAPAIYGEISRAGFKLAEALETFGVELPVGGQALDLGASPGGFCALLLDKGLNVTAVDPAELDPRVAANPRLTRFKCLAQDFVKACGRNLPAYDIITNDMRLDKAESADIINGMGSLLKDGGCVIMTLKLADGHWLKQVKTAVERLERAFGVVKTRQLFHNRSEVTVFLSNYRFDKGR